MATIVISVVRRPEPARESISIILENYHSYIQMQEFKLQSVLTLEHNLLKIQLAFIISKRIHFYGLW